jgi:enamine deaminase RidA (YjgF/YER057c/UK114 family)
MNKLLILGLMVALGAVARAEEKTPEQKLAALGHELPAVPPAIASYVPAVRAEKLVFLSGQIPLGKDGKFIAGKVGRTFTEEQATEAARMCALQLLASLRGEIGDLARVKRIVRVGGFVNCTDDFTGQSRVINGASDLLVAVFGDAGKHARTSIGVASLPAGAPVEVDLVAELH